MKMTKKFLVLSTFIISICMMVLLATITLSCAIMLVLSICWGMWKDVLVAFAIGYISALGGFSFLDTADWLLEVYRRLKSE